MEFFLRAKGSSICIFAKLKKNTIFNFYNVQQLNWLQLLLCKSLLHAQCTWYCLLLFSTNYLFIFIFFFKKMTKWCRLYRRNSMNVPTTVCIWMNSNDHHAVQKLFCLNERSRKIQTKKWNYSRHIYDRMLAKSGRSLWIMWIGFFYPFNQYFFFSTHSHFNLLYSLYSYAVICIKSLKTLVP